MNQYPRAFSWEPNRRRVQNVLACWGAATLALGLVPAAKAQEFDSGSTGVDGGLDLIGTPAGTTVVFDPGAQNPKLDADGDGVYHFTHVYIPEGVTLALTVAKMGPRSVIWRVSGDVTLEGTLDLSGENGHAAVEQRRFSTPGPGGFAGGVGKISVTNAPASGGFGPGAGKASTCYGAAAGHATDALPYSNNHELIGKSYGNTFIVPLLGGSGGSGAIGGSGCGSGGGGGAGGGAILIAASGTIHLGEAGHTAIRADAGDAPGYGGGGSGGAIRLMAPTVSGGGALSTQGGCTWWDRGGCHDGRWRYGSKGRVRIEALHHEETGSIVGLTRKVTLVPEPIIESPVEYPTLRVLSVDGEPVPANPTGGFTPADVTINSPDPVDILIEAARVPVGTRVTVDVFSEEEGITSHVTTPLQGELALSTTTLSVALTPGYSYVTLRANFEH